MANLLLVFPFSNVALVSSQGEQLRISSEVIGEVLQMLTAAFKEKKEQR